MIQNCLSSISFTAKPELPIMLLKLVFNILSKRFQELDPQVCVLIATFHAYNKVSMIFLLQI